MWKILGKINQNLIWAIPVMMLAGFLFGWSTETVWLKKLILPFTFLMVYPMMVNLKIKKVFELGDGKAQFLAQGINFAVVPFLAYGIGLIFFPDHPYMILGLVLAGLVPTSGMTISWTGMAGGNLAAAIKMTVIGLTLGSLATPFYIQYLLGASLQVDLAAVFQQIALVVFLPMAAGYLTQRVLVRRFGQQTFQGKVGPRFPPLSTLGVLGIVFIAMAVKARGIAADPGLMLYIIAPLALMYAVNFLLSTLVGKAVLNRADAIAMVYGTVMRNLSIALAVAMSAFGEGGSEAALVIAVAYIIQVQAAAWYVRFTGRIFGEVEPAAAPLPVVAG